MGEECVGLQDKQQTFGCGRTCRKQRVCRCLALPAGQSAFCAKPADAVLDGPFGKRLMGYMPANLKIIGQIIIGGTIGMNFTKSSLAEMKQVFFPAVISVVILLTVGVIAGYILHKVAGIDLITALLGTSPGGLTDMTILAAAFEADTIIVSSIHLVRLFSVILLMPIFVRIISTYINK